MSEHEFRRGFMCKIAFDHELGIKASSPIYASLDDLYAAHAFADDCGVVEVEITPVTITEGSI
jgi:hypothetical protein